MRYCLPDGRSYELPEDDSRQPGAKASLAEQAEAVRDVLGATEAERAERRRARGGLSKIVNEKETARHAPVGHDGQAGGSERA